MIPYEEIQLLTSIMGEESQAGESGASGKVVKGLWRGKVVAVKLMHFQNVENFEPGWRKGIQDVNESKKKEIEKEAENYSKLNHPNIIKFYGLTRVGNCVHIVIEYVEGGSLQELIERTVKKIELLDAVKKIQIALDVAVGVNYLHVDQKMVHRDLKPQNILICEGYRAKLCDFGSARNVANVTLQNVGTMLYAAPEVFKQKGGKMGSYAADVYSFGVVFWCLFFETDPPGMRETMPPETVPRVACERKTAKAVVAVVKECCGVKPEGRTRMKEVVGKLEKMLEELKRRNYQKVVNEVDRLNLEFSQREAALKSKFTQRDAVLNSKIAELQKGLKAKESEIRKMEKRLNQVQKEAAAKGVENKRLRSELERSTKELELSRKSMDKIAPKSKEAIVVKEKQREMEMQPSSSSVAVQFPGGFKSQWGILVPQNVVFEVNEKYRSVLERVFSNGNKVAKGIGSYSCFKSSAVFTAGKKFYFQVSANVSDGGHMGFGILSGEVTTWRVGYHEKGWEYYCYPRGTPKRSIKHNNQDSSVGYGPERTTGKHKYGIFCDFTDGKGELSFVVDGKNWGVAYKNLKPPVSPAFYVFMKGDSFKIEDSFELPNRELEITVIKTPLSKESIVVKEEQSEMEVQPSSVAVPKAVFKSQRGILVPQNVIFEMNEKYCSRLKKMFSNGNKVAKGIDDFSCFKTSAVFTAGKKFYFQVSANVGSGSSMGFGIMSGEVTAHYVGYHEKGWDYNCYPGIKRTYHNKIVSYGYGPKRTVGKHKFGIFCDLTDGKREVSFIVDGKNWGVAYQNFEPPVSPAFYMYKGEDSFKIEDNFEVPDCL